MKSNKKNSIREVAIISLDILYSLRVYHHDVRLMTNKFYLSIDNHKHTVGAKIIR